MKKLLFIAVTLMTIASCSKKDETTTPVTPQPIANFGYTLFNNNLHAPATINFTNSSSNYISSSWNFGGLGTSVLTNPSFKFTTAGSFNVSLTATYYNGTISTQASKDQAINILAPYTQLKINSIPLDSTPTKTSTFTGYFRITNSSGTELYKSPNLSINPNSLPSQHNLTTPLTITNLNSTYYIELYEYFTWQQDVKLSKTTFIPYLYNTGNSSISSYPTSVTLTKGISLNITWQ